MDGIFMEKFFVWFWGVLFQRKKVSSTFGFLFNRGTKIKKQGVSVVQQNKKGDLFVCIILNRRIHLPRGNRKFFFLYLFGLDSI
jgi:hypothetical protein